MTFSCHDRLPLLSNPRIADLFASTMRAIFIEAEVALYAWVVMPEHVHALVNPGERPLGPSLSRLKQSVAQSVILRWKQLDAPVLTRIIDDRGRLRFWQRGGGFDRNTRSEGEFTKSIRYIHRNPVRRGLVDRPEDWRWSSVRWWRGVRDGEVACDPVPGERWAAWEGFV